MKILIAAASKTGTALKCAELLAEKLNGAEVADLTQKQPDISGYDIVIIGGSIRAGMLHKKATEFIQKNAELLKDKKHAFYICCGSPENAKDVFQKNFPAQLLENSIAAECFGGELDISKMKGMDKFITKMVMNASKNDPAKEKPHILTENISAFALKIIG